MAVVEVEGLRVGYERVGTGPALVLLHGAFADRRVWRWQAPLAEQFTLIAWDTPGCGESTDAPAGFRLPDYARVLARLLDVLEVRRPHVVGHSWGAGLALQLAVDFPALPASLVLAGGYAGWAGSLPPDEVQRRVASARQAAAALPRDFDPATVPGLFSARLPAEHAAFLAELMRESRPAAILQMADAFAAADLRGDLARVAVPTLLLHGADDQRAHRPVAEALRQRIPHAELVVLADLGHEMLLEDPEACNEAILRFLSSPPAGAASGATVGA